MIQYFFPTKEVPILVWSKRDGGELRNIIRSWLILGNPGTVLVVRDVNSRARNHGGVKDGGND